jgi:N-methylhydantoinase A
VTDANVVLGRIDPTRFLDGRLPLDPEAARRALHDRVARPLDLSDERAAEAVLEMSSATMARALRVVTVGRGRDPAALPLVAFGGAGPLHAARLADELGSPAVLVPALPGFISAAGLLATELRTEAAETVLRPGERNRDRALGQTVIRLGSRAAKRLGAEATEVELSTSVDCRYEGQGYELTVPLDAPTEAGLARARDRFHVLHDAVHGHSAPDEPVEVVAVRVSASAPGGGLHPRAFGLQASGPARRTEVRKVFDAGGWTDAPVKDRGSLGPGWRGTGPLLIEDGASTVWVPGGHRCEVGEFGTVEVTRG